MDRIARCLSQIEAIRDVAAGDVPPYVARSRIGRLASSVAALAAELGGLPELPVDERFAAPGNSSQFKALASSVKRLRDASRHVAQPSEPLEVRWRRAWAELLEELSILERCINKMRGNDLAT